MITEESSVESAGEVPGENVLRDFQKSIAETTREVVADNVFLIGKRVKSG